VYQNRRPGLPGPSLSMTPLIWCESWSTSGICTEPTADCVLVETVMKQLPEGLPRKYLDMIFMTDSKESEDENQHGS